jgi:hypothetical protein
MPDHIKQIIEPTAAWFRIQTEHVEGKTFHSMSRVVVWTVVSDEPRTPDHSTQDRFEGIDANGFGHLEDFIEYGYVHGDDIAPNGKNWRTVFNETPSSSWGYKDISALAQMRNEQSKPESDE